MRRIRRIRRRKINHDGHATAGNDAASASSAQEPSSRGQSRVVIIGNRVFNIKLAKLVEDETDFDVVAIANEYKQAFAYPNEYEADLVVVDVDFGGTASGIALARDLNERRPGCGFMLVCGPFTSTIVKALWVYGADAWSVITQATAKNPAHFAEAVSSAVHGIPWVEPGVKRDLRGFGPRPDSFDERKLAMFESDQAKSA